MKLDFSPNLMPQFFYLLNLLLIIMSNNYKCKRKNWYEKNFTKHKN